MTGVGLTVMDPAGTEADPDRVLTYPALLISTTFRSLVLLSGMIFFRLPHGCFSCILAVEFEILAVPVEDWYLAYFKWTLLLLV